MSEAKPKKSRTAKPERVEAEFEPAPDNAAEPAHEGEGKSAKGSGLPWLKITGFCLAAAMIGGLSGYGLGRVWPVSEPVDVSAIEARLSALETAEPVTTDLTPIENRIDDLESASALRGQALPEIADRLRTLETQPVGPTGESADLSEIEARLNALEDGLRLAGNDAASARSSLEQLQTFMMSQPGEQAGGAGPVDTAQLSLLQGELSALSQRVAALEDGEAFDPSVLDDFDQRLSALDRQIAQLDGDAMAAGVEPGVLSQTSPVEDASQSQRALAFAQLVRGASGTEPFAVELAELRRVWPSAPAAAGLVDIAREGALDGAALKASFPALPLRQLTGETQLYFGVLRVDRSGEPGPAAQIEAALDAEDLPAAQNLTQGLTGEAAALIAPWRSQLEARLAVSSALERMANTLAQEGASWSD